MPTAVQDKVDERATLWAANTALMDLAQAEKRELTAAEAEEYDRRDAEIDRLEASIARDQRHSERAKGMNSVDRRGLPAAFGGPEDGDEEETQKAYDRVFSSFIRNGALEMTAEDRQLLQAQFRQDQAIKNAAGVGTGAAGGYTVPPAFRDRMVETMKYYGPMLDLAETITTTSGVNLPWPTNDDTANVGAILAENTQVTEQDVTLGTNSLDAYMYTSKLVRVSFQLLQDRPDFDSWLARKLGERIGRIWNQHFTTGTGTSQPDGIVTSATVGVTSTGSFASTGGVSGDNLIDLVESLDPAYGAGDGLRWMLHQSARKAIRKLKDSQNRYLFEPSLQAGVPDSLYGYPLSINNDMATMATSSKSILFGNIREAYVIRTVQDIQSLRLTERYADFLQVGFLAFARADGTMQNANAVRVLQTTATA